MFYQKIVKAAEADDNVSFTSLHLQFASWSTV